jgi:predicted outer membrane repeat protein
MNKSTTNSRFLASLRLLFLSSFICCSLTTKAVVFEVTTAEELQAALVSASENDGDDRILLAPGTYVGNFKYSAREDRSLYIGSKDKSAPAIVDAGARNFGLYIEGDQRFIAIDLEGFEIRNASTDAMGGGLLARSIYGSLTLNGMRFISNSAKDGGGLYAEKVGTLSIDKTVFEGNVATQGGYGGGAILAKNVAYLLVDHSTFLSNDAREGAAISYTVNNTDLGWASGNDRSLAVNRSIFKRNGFQSSGGVLSINVTGSGHQNLEVAENEILENTGLPLAIESYGVPVIVTDNSVERNDCRGGRVLYINVNGQMGSEGKLRIERNSFSNNEGCSYVDVRGGLSPQDNSVSIIGNLFAGLYLSFYTGDTIKSLSLVNNTFASFSAPSTFEFGSDFEMEIINNIFHSLANDLDVKLVGVLKRGLLKNNIFGEVGGYWDVEENNLLLDPMFFDYPQGDYHLSFESPGLDAGDSSYLYDELVTDLDGNPRIVGDRVDIGAYERSTGSMHPADTNGDRVISEEEFNLYNAHWRTNEHWSTKPVVIPVDFVTRAGYLLQKGGSYKDIGVGKPSTWVPLNE